MVFMPLGERGLHSQLTLPKESSAYSSACLAILILIALPGRERSLESELHLFI